MPQLEPTPATPLGDLYRYHAEKWEERRALWQAIQKGDYAGGSSFHNLPEHERNPRLEELIQMATAHRDGFERLAERHDS